MQSTRSCQKKTNCQWIQKHLRWNVDENRSKLLLLKTNNWNSPCYLFGHRNATGHGRLNSEIYSTCASKRKPYWKMGISFYQSIMPNKLIDFEIVRRTVLQHSLIHSPAGRSYLLEKKRSVFSLLRDTQCNNSRCAMRRRKKNNKCVSDYRMSQRDSQTWSSRTTTIGFHGCCNCV